MLNKHVKLSSGLGLAKLPKGPSTDRELIKRGTSIDQLVTEVMSGEVSFDSDIKTAVAIAELKHLCPDYEPSQLVVLGTPVGGVMCRSGENSGGRAYRSECRQCLVGQFYLSTGQFWGIEEA